MMTPRIIFPSGPPPPVNVTRDLAAVVAGLRPERLAILAGAGISVEPPACLPTAGTFMRELAVHSLPADCDPGLYFPEHTLPGHPSIRFELLMDVIEHRVDSTLELLSIYGDGQANLNHHCLADLARAGAVIVTTNFDGLIERALGEAPFRSRFRPSDFELGDIGAAGAMREPEVWHLHGMARHPSTGKDCRDSVVASVTGCWQARDGFRLEAGKGRALRCLLQNRDLLIVGYSGADDYDIAPTLEEIDSPRHIVWFKHLTPEELEKIGLAKLPLMMDLFPDRGICYRDPAANSLAAMISTGRRLAQRVGLVQGDTTSLLTRLAGRNGDRPPDKAASPSLSDHFVSWADRHLPSEMLKIRLALLLAGTIGLHEERRRLAADFLERSEELLRRAGPSPESIGMGVELICLSSAIFPAERGAIIGQLIESVGPREPLVEAVLLVEQARACSEAGRLEDAIQHLRRSLELRQALPGQPDIHVVHHDLGWAYLGRDFELSKARRPLWATKSTEVGFLKRAGLHAVAALEASRKIVSLEGEARSLRLLARVQERLGSPEARQSFERSIAVARSTADPGLIGTSEGELGLFLAVQGESQDAVPHLSEAWRYHARAGEPDGLLQVGSNLAQCLEVLATLGDEEAGGRSLLADCVTWQAAMALSDAKTAKMALSRIRKGVRREAVQVASSKADTAAWVEAVRQALAEQDVRI